jgi:phosphoglycolate phosphatase-like HAD superfamily hydrolase
VKLLLFDIDQTLVNTGGAGLRALDRACTKLLGIEHAMQGISPHGRTDPAIVREIYRVKLTTPSPEPTQITSILESYVSFLKQEVAESPAYRVLPGIIPLLKELSAREDAVLGLATGNVELGARIKLERGDLNSYFPFGGFGSDAEDRSELVRAAAQKAADKIGAWISPHDTYVIGDTPLDIDAGYRCGFKTVGVATGSYSVEQLLAAGATIAVSDLDSGHDYFLRSTFIA